MSAERITPGSPAPDFSAEDLHGRPVRLADYFGKKFVLLVFNRGFA